MIGQGGFVDGIEIIGGDHRIGAHIAKQGDFLPLFVGNRMLGAADQNIWGNANGLQFFNAVLRGFGFQLAAGREIRQQREMHENTIPAWLVVGELANGFKKRQAFNIAHCAANFAEHKIDFIVTDFQKLFNFVGDMGHHLNGFAQIVAAALFFQHG